MLDDARAQVNFFVNITNFALLIAFASVAGAAYDLDWLHFTTRNTQILDSVRTLLGVAGLRHIAWAASGFVIAALAYWQATARVKVWGDLVKSAFDCYLPALTKQLGFALPPPGGNVASSGKNSVGLSSSSCQ